MKKPLSRTFRPWEQNQERLELADKIGLNVSELINEVLREHLSKHMQTKAEKIRQALAVPVK